jgi:hypothetical protein
VSGQTTKIYDEFRSRLATVRKREESAALLRGVLLAVTAFLGTVLLALALEGILYLEVPARTILFWLLLFVAGTLVALYIVRPALRLVGLLPHESDVATAQRVGRRLPDVGDRIVNILQLFHERDGKELYSTELIDAAFEDAGKEFAGVDLSARADVSAPRRVAKLLGATVALALLLLAVFPSTFLGAAARLLHHDQSFAPPVAFSFLVEPGDKEVVKGETVSIRVRVEGEQLTSITLSSKPEGQQEYESRTILATPEGLFQDEIRSLKNTTSYYVRARDNRSREYTLKVIDRPVVKLLRIQLQPPAYSGLPATQLNDNQGDVQGLKGTRISFLVESSKELSAAALVTEAHSRVSLNLDGRRATTDITLTKEYTYQIALVDREGVANADPITYRVGILPDAYPTAAILLPGQNVDIAENEQLPMLFKITDDYGFSRLRLAYKLVQSRYEKPAEAFSFTTIPLPVGTRKETTVPYTWSLSDLHLVPEDAVRYYIEVFDNDNVSGPKSATSETYLLRLPSLEEVFADLEKGHELSLDALHETLKEAQAAKEDLDELRRELKNDQQKMDWQDQKKAEDMAKKYEAIQKKLAEVNATVDQMVSDMQKNKVLSPETLEKYQQLQQLMQEMSSPEFAEAMKRLQQVMRQLDPRQVRRALEQFSLSEENFRKSIERTISLLKRIQIEQRVDEALQRAEKLVEKQEELHQQTEKQPSQDSERANKLAEQQQDLKRQLEGLREQLAELQKQMQEFPAEMPLSEMEKALDHLSESGLDQDLGEITRQLQTQRMEQAAEGQKGALQKMGQFMQRLQDMQNAMRENQQRQIVNEMRRAMQDLLNLSKRQEELASESQRLERNSPLFRENAQGQMNALQDLTQVANHLSQVSQKTFGVTPEMGKALGDAARSMGQAMQSLEQRDGGAAGQQQNAAMASLNEAAQLVQAALDGMMQGGGQGMGMAGFLQRLQQLSGMQQGINQGTQNLGELSAQQAAEMARLAGEQGMVRKSLEELAKEAAQAGQLSKLLGDLNAVAQDMREVQTDLAQGNVNPETMRKQERIMSRLLDSQRSMRERDYEKKRRAETGKERLHESPEEIDLTTREGRNRLREDLLKALEEGYARDYQELIKQYFEALEQEQLRP